MTSKLDQISAKLEEISANPEVLNPQPSDRKSVQLKPQEGEVPSLSKQNSDVINVEYKYLYKYQCMDQTSTVDHNSHKSTNHDQ